MCEERVESTNVENLMIPKSPLSDSELVLGFSGVWGEMSKRAVNLMGQDPKSQKGNQSTKEVFLPTPNKYLCASIQAHEITHISFIRTPFQLLLISVHTLF